MTNENASSSTCLGNGSFGDSLVLIDESISSDHDLMRIQGIRRIHSLATHQLGTMVRHSTSRGDEKSNDKDG